MMMLEILKQLVSLNFNKKLEKLTTHAGDCIFLVKVEHKSENTAHEH